MNFRMPDTYYDPPSPRDLTFTPSGECDGTLTKMRLQPRELAEDFARLAGYVDDSLTSATAHDRAVRLLRVITNECAGMPVVEEDFDCGFSDEVDATVLGGVAQWTCPRCGETKEEDVEY